MKNFTVVYADDDILIVDKPQGLPTTPGKSGGSLFDEVSAGFPELKAVKGYKKNEGGLLNRLDNETGGLVFFARNHESFGYYSRLMKENKIVKTYRAIVDGVPVEKKGRIEVEIAHDRKNKRKMVCLKGRSKHRGTARPALTEWTVLDIKNGRSLLELKITKGARHQIRVHLAYIGSPIVGDKLYNKTKRESANCHQLYCVGASFVTMSNVKKDITIESPLIF
jgi:23S rRNA pseudouridine1911/1915/1917 synthase